MNPYQRDQMKIPLLFQFRSQYRRSRNYISKIVSSGIALCPYTVASASRLFKRSRYSFQRNHSLNRSISKNITERVKFRKGNLSQGDLRSFNKLSIINITNEMSRGKVIFKSSKIFEKNEEKV